MASSSETGRTTENAVDKPEAAQEEEPKNMHVALHWEVIEELKSATDWGPTHSNWAYDEEKVQLVWEQQSRLSIEQLFNRVLYGDEEVVVWEDDTFGVQKIKEIPQPPLQ
ncbi:hypothetical protein ACH5RR_018646 [Cinchona calisaya]|uniref:Uncharacterized protein n=1 Tax=Cinchona calisaya TaxID=153742 RepID=A0ABD2ZM27_9GENT